MDRPPLSRIAAALAILIALTCATGAPAQAPSDPALEDPAIQVPALSGGSMLPQIQDLIPDARAVDGSAGIDAALFPDLPPDYRMDEATRASLQASVKGYYDYRVAAYRHRLQVFRWQHRSSQIIFVTVIAIVAVALYFSWTQFHASDRGRDMPGNDLELGKTGIKIASPVLGVVILTLSLGFFYLYLTHVYPITELF